MGPDGKPAPPGLIPTLEESVEQKVWVIGRPEEVAEGIAGYRDALSLEHLTVFPHFPGDSYDDAEEQMAPATCRRSCRCSDRRLREMTSSPQAQ